MSLDTPVLLSDYIKKENQYSSYFIPAKKFNDDEFSDNDIQMLNLISNFIGNKNSKILVDHTHAHDSLWRRSAIKSGMLAALGKEFLNSTEFYIDFSLLFENNPERLSEYYDTMEHIEFSRRLKH